MKSKRKEKVRVKADLNVCVGGVGVRGPSWVEV